MASKKSKLKLYGLLALFVLCSFIFAACGGSAPTATPMVTETPNPYPFTLNGCGNTDYKIVNASTVRDFKCTPNDTFTAYINDRFVRGYIRLEAGPWIYENDPVNLTSDVDLINEANDKIDGTTCKQVIGEGRYSDAGTSWTVYPQTVEDEYSVLCTNDSWSVIGTMSVIVKSQTANVGPLPQAPLITWENQENGEQYLQCVNIPQADIWLFPSSVDLSLIGLDGWGEHGEKLLIHERTQTCIPTTTLNKDKYRVLYNGIAYTLDMRYVPGGYAYVPVADMHPGWNYYVCADGNVAFYGFDNAMENCVHGTYLRTENGSSYFTVDEDLTVLVSMSGAFPSPQQ